MADVDPLPHCETCAYSDDGDSPAEPEDGLWLLCRRHPPRVFGPADDGYEGGAGVFPRVARRGWCGEWIRSPLNAGMIERLDFLQAEIAATETDLGDG